MYYKVIYNDKVIDVLDKLVYLKYQEKHDRMIFCSESEAQAIFSSDGSEIWNVEGLYDLPVSGYDTVRIEKIDKYEYKQLKALNYKSEEEVIDMAILSLINGDSSIFNDSLERLYLNQEIDRDTMMKFEYLFVV